MRNIVNNNYANVTCEFAFHGGTGYAVAYYGGANSEATERLWMKPIAFEGCKSRDEAELKAIYYLINGDRRKDSYGIGASAAYRGFNRNTRIMLIGFDAFERGVYAKHKANQEAWQAVLQLFGMGRDGLHFDLVSINNTVSKAIRNAETFRWTALNREEHANQFAAMVKKQLAVAKTARAAQAKATTAAVAESGHGISAKAEPVAEAKVA